MSLGSGGCVQDVFAASSVRSSFRRVMTTENRTRKMWRSRNTSTRLKGYYAVPGRFVAADRRASFIRVREIYKSRREKDSQTQRRTERKNGGEKDRQRDAKTDSRYGLTVQGRLAAVSEVHIVNRQTLARAREKLVHREI